MEAKVGFSIPKNPYNSTLFDHIEDLIFVWSCQALFIEGTITAAKYLALSWNHDSYCPEASNVFSGELFKTPKSPCLGSDKEPISSSTPLTSSSQKIRKKISNEGKPQ